ncbi:MAG: NAD-dependent epimerase/dehydratase family protein [Flavobacteriales bacterium]
MKKVLILGGTNFIGRNLVEKFLELDEYEITLFNRQVTHSTLFPSVNRIKGDRESDDITKISRTDWNYVIDLSCYYPQALERVLKSINKVDKYIFISTCSVYDIEANSSVMKDEESKILSCSISQLADRSTDSYGNRKAECERILVNSGVPFIILRPALVFGKYDSTDRFYYWLFQVKKMDTILLPENGKRIFSTTYVHDLVDAIIRSLSQSVSSEVFNVITNPKTSIEQVVNIAGQTLRTEFSSAHASLSFLEKNQVNQWTDIPLWLKTDSFTFSNERVMHKLGMKPTEFEVSISETIRFYEKLDWPKPKSGFSESKLLDLIEELKTDESCS